MDHAYGPTHQHAALVTCPCGTEIGVTAVVFPDGYDPGQSCPDCGKPVDDWGDRSPVHQVDVHAFGCPAHPETGS